MREPLTGQPCDTLHPFPSPGELGMIDSMEFGADERLRPGGKPTMWDRDTDATWRMAGAWVWGAECLDDHLAQVAEDPYLTTHLIAVSVVAYPPENADAITRLGFAQAGAGEVFAALKSGGLEEGFRTVEQMPVGVRKTAIGECLAHILHGFTALQLDIGARFPS